ncbi:hypothetical protein BsWGS_17572 [Bradybaena similaris]
MPAPIAIVTRDHVSSQGRLHRQEYQAPVTAASHVRRDLDSLSQGEVESLRSAFLDIQKDHTYEKIASFHGKPGLCEHGGRKVGCCVHGRPTFPAWHRLYVKEVEIALLKRGSSVAVPYWDWTQPMTQLPDLINEAAYFNSRQQEFEPNPFFSGVVAGESSRTIRNPRPELYHNEELREQTLLALEQDNFCDFEVQFEVLHNRLHSLLGGRARVSMATLDYAAFDPVFFLHHSNTDRIWAIWQELQRYRGLSYNEADCAINLMRNPLLPFGANTSDHSSLTFKYSRPVDVFDYRNNLQYEYDTLELNNLTIPQLEILLKRRQEHGRIFAGFLLRNIGLSADVDIFICASSGTRGKKKCDHKAGVFSILGGDLEMPFVFDRLYRHEITKSVRDLGLPLDSAAKFELLVEVKANNGSLLDSSILSPPTIAFVPGTKDRQDEFGNTGHYLVRKDVNSLNPREKLSLVHALRGLQADRSAEGYQSLAAYHALPPLCPSPEESQRHACCVHGMATFPHWHRLYTVQFEDGLRRHGSLVGVPYWDWTGEIDALPSFLADQVFTDPYTGAVYDNPFNDATIEFEDTVVEREILGQYLYKRGPQGWDTWLLQQTLLALEQEDFCDFEIQLEVTHNAIHSWLGGSKEHSMGHLHYASYDPVFFLHHANTDRIWAIWQELQKHRGHSPNEANCALELMREPLKPFSFGSPYNLNTVTQEYSRPEDTFDYSRHFGYLYDELSFAGMTVPTLDAFIKERQGHDRVFAGFFLSGLGTSARVDFEICSQGKCFDAGYFTILGGSAEMPWHFDRLYKYEITSQLKEHNLRSDDEYQLKVHVMFPNGTEVPSHPIPTPNVLLEPAKQTHSSTTLAPNRIRQDLSTLSERDVTSLKAALHQLQLDTSTDGWTHLASFHGAPAQCPDPEHPTVACCQHGMPTFPHWHRLFTLQIEQALEKHGSSVAIPYWDWTRAITELPSVFTQPTFYDVWKDEVYINPFSRGYVPSEQAYTVRDVLPELFETTKDGKHSKLLELVLLALEQVDYCDFEVQFEIMHNALHYLVGGHQNYSLSSLEYSAYDPIFFIHHSFTDKIWIVWQQLQKRRHLAYNRADCAINHMTKPMKPFSFEGFNKNRFTREHAVPNSVFDHKTLGYDYDNLNIGDYNLGQLQKLIAAKQSRGRVFAGILLSGVGRSCTVELHVCVPLSFFGQKPCGLAARFNLLGGPTESRWMFDRLLKLDITETLLAHGLKPEDLLDATAHISLDVKVFDVEGRDLSQSKLFREPTIIYDPPHGAADDALATAIGGISFRKDVSTLSKSEITNLREALGKVQEDAGPNGFKSIASFHGEPLCGSAARPRACCVHGMANFPQWHRVYLKQWEDALKAKGAKIGIPYWDWTQSFSTLPTLVTELDNNPFHHGVTFNGHSTTRAPRDALFNDTEFGSQFFYRQILLAFEQTDYCNFEVQFEITHNAIHSWTGGKSPYGMSTLEYTAYDPLFLLHHSNVDRQFAIWQALQKFRGLPHNSANCAIQLLHQPMRPFSDEDNNNPTTSINFRAIDAFDYDRLNYHYDNLNFHELSIEELNELLEKRRQADRIFAEFLLLGLRTSADIVFHLCDAQNRCQFAGTFSVLGGPTEMPWMYDRLFRYDVTQVFSSLNLRSDSEFHFRVNITAVNGTHLDPRVLRSPSVQFVPGVKRYHVVTAPGSLPERTHGLTRKSVLDLTAAEAASLKGALRKLQEDAGPNGFEAIAGFHGAPFLCPETGAEKFACCLHGTPIFPHWHRLMTLQFEQALQKAGALTGVPYWDWTEPTTSVPAFFSDGSNNNPFHDYHIKFANKITTRELPASFVDVHKHLYQVVLGVLEEDNYCDFEIQLELLHNELHFRMGGDDGTYSMSNLDYSAFDPFFMILHSSFDRIWIIWQELQKIRRKSFSPASCAGHVMDEPLHPFDYPSVNKNDLTRRNSVPSLISDYRRLGYKYDKLELNGHDVQELNSIISSRRSQDQLFLAYVLYGSQISVHCHFSIVNNKGELEAVGVIYLLGSSKEMPWSYDRVYKLDASKAAKAAGHSADRPIKAHQGKCNLPGQVIPDLPNPEHYPLMVHRPAHVDYDVLIVSLGRNNTIPPTAVLKKGTRIKFLPISDEFNFPIEDLGSYIHFTKCKIPSFSYNSYALGVVHVLKPGEYYFVPRNKQQCEEKQKIHIRVEGV